jgi:hypothetical protein
MASSTGSVTGRFAAAFADGEALGAGEAAGVADVFAVVGAAVFAGPAVVQPEAASNAREATSASGDFKIVFINSILIDF